MVGVIKVLDTDWVTVASKKFLSLGGIDQQLAVSATTLFLLIIADGTWNAGATTDLSIQFEFEQK